jgi:N-acetylglutamate synthase-like GNAT family acetyltransferase
VVKANLIVRRARPVDAEPIAQLLAAATRGRLRVDELDVIERLGLRGYFVANTDTLVGLAGWTAENLVARIEDFIVHPPEMRPIAGRELLNHIEDAAAQLECEAALLLVPRNVSEPAVKFYESCGYGFKHLSDMPLAWRDSAEEVLSDNLVVMVKQLRAQLVGTPIG